MKIEEKDLIALKKIQEEKVDILNIWILSCLQDNLPKETEYGTLLIMANYVLRVWIKDDNHYDICYIADVTAENWDKIKNGSKFYELI